jgi:DNA-binding NarL/FixJ family response regulator
MRLYPNEYKNAREVLPEDLIRKLQRIYTGPVWVPRLRRREIKTKGTKERDEKILKLYSQGKTMEQISEEVFLCKERVRQIIRSNGGFPHGR